MIEALWIDDECKNQDGLTDMGKGFVDLAYVYGIKITPMLTYKEGIDAIKKSPLRWSAVILDIHNQKATTGKASDDFDDAREQIIRFQAQHNQGEPFIFVLSGNKQYQTESSTIKKPDFKSGFFAHKHRSLCNYFLLNAFTDNLQKCHNHCQEKTYQVC